MKGIRSIFLKNFIIYSLVVMLSFTALGGAFIYQISRYAARERESALDAAVSRASAFTSEYMQTAPNMIGSSFSLKAYEKIYRTSIMNLAENLGGILFVCNAKGELVFFATGEGCYVHEQKVQIPQAARDAIGQKGRFYEMGNFSGLLTAPHYTLGTLAQSGDGQTVGMVFASLPADSSLKLFANISSTFILMIFIVFLVVLAVTYVMVNSTLRPLKNIAAATRRFGRGDFSARVAVPKQRDELYALIVSFNHMADAIENTEKQRRDLIANVSHDLRTPMTTIGGFIDGILDGAIPPEKQEYYLRIVSEEIKRLARMANSMVEVSRLESGQRALNRTTFDISEMVRRIVLGFERQLTEKEIDLNLDIPEKLEISADHDAIFQVVYNLVDNAVKYTQEQGQIILYLSAKGGKMQCNIVNTGPGIAPEDINHIFERFYKGDRSRNAKVTSSGLGLYIVKTLVNRHGGDIYAKSGNGQTEFCFMLPVNPAKSEELTQHS